jgi:hypothetical protein
MTGVLSSYQQYADLMLALMRVQGATSVSRSGYILIDPIVPNLTPEDQIGRPRPENAAPIPDNPLQRLEYFQSQGSTTGFAGAGNFGTGNDLTRGAMPRDSIVTVTLVVAGHDLRVPDARATLSASGGATPAGGPPTGAAPGGPPAGRPPGPGGGGADGQGAGDEG